ncbi:uncharacterized protein LOC130743838 [Lotus japonicus]|uniref:uncharacterized protein LOC130743838 n=1 Tax=Lotus japonicus TaxID=34305 RepID=UPI002591275B|nr:uncharacterized protein LOC130743838 [Lotus japonicus]
MSYNIFSWNIRGAAAKGVPLLLKDIVLRHNVSCLAILEPRVSAAKIPLILKTVGFDDFFVVEVEGFSGGIWVMWQKNWGSVEIISSHRQFIHTRITPKGNLPSLLVTFVYGSPNYSIREILWRELRCLASTMQTPWMVLGDFNAYLSSSDKLGGGPANTVAMNKFRSCLDDCSLSEFGFKGPPFTWEGRGIKERIDWVLGNDSCFTSFPEASVLHLPRLKSDHNPLLLQLRAPASCNTQRPFRFLAAWLTHEDFPRLVSETWQNHEEWVPASNSFQDAATIWNTQVFGEIGRKKRHLMSRLEGINNRLRMSHIPYLEKLQKRLWGDYQRILVQEELLWR